MNYPLPPAADASAAAAPARSWPLWYPWPLAWYERVPLVLVGAVLVILLGVSLRLTPDPAGLGTHHQLGLPMCSVRQFLGIRCPSCGMTTSWSHMVRGQVLSAVQANSGGALLALAAAMCGPWLVTSGVRGRWLIGRPAEEIVVVAGITIIVVTLIQWTLRLSLGW